MPYEKRPAEKKDYQVDWTAHLLVNGVDAGDAIAASTWTLETGITGSAEASTSKTATIWLEGGTEGVHYTVTNRITTSQGRIFERSFVVQVKAAPAG